MASSAFFHKRSDITNFYSKGRNTLGLHRSSASSEETSINEHIDHRAVGIFELNKECNLIDINMRK